MRLLDIFRIALRMIRTNLLRSFLNVFGIGIAISFIVVLITLGYGLQTLTIGSILQSKSLLSVDVFPTNAKSSQDLSTDSLKELSALPGVQSITPVVGTTGVMKIDDKLVSVAVTAAKQNYFEMEGLTVSKGKSFTDLSQEIVVSSSTLDLLNLSPDGSVGRNIDLTYTDPNNNNLTKSLTGLTIVGISTGDDSPTIYLPYSLVTKDGEVKLSSVKIVGINRQAVVDIRQAATNKGYQADSLLDTLDQARKVFYWATVGLAVFGAIALIVAAIGMFNTLTIALIERTREIGIMKAIGITDHDVLRLFLTEAGVIGFLGGLAGIGFGLGADMLFGFLINQLGKLYQAAPVKLFQAPPWFLLAMLAFPVVLALVTGLYPALRAARLNPLRALRYE